MLVDLETTDGGHERLLVTLSKLEAIQYINVLKELRRTFILDYIENYTNLEKILCYHTAFHEHDEAHLWFNLKIKLANARAYEK